MNKKEIINSHSITILSDCMLTALENIKTPNEFTKEFKEAVQIVRDGSSKILDESFKAETVSKSNYIADVSHKIFTVIRKNFKSM